MNPPRTPACSHARNDASFAARRQSLHVSLVPCLAMLGCARSPTLAPDADVTPDVSVEAPDVPLEARDARAFDAPSVVDAPPVVDAPSIVDGPVSTDAPAACDAVTFTLRGESGASAVWLTGDFTTPRAWAPDLAGGALPMRHDGDAWTLSRALSPGRHAYKFVVDGTRWVYEPSAATEPDGLGGRNNTVDACPTPDAGAPVDVVTPRDGPVTSDVVLPSGHPPIYIAFHWHMHQPIYWPYESILESERMNRMGYSLVTIHTDRTGPYTGWPRDAVGAGRDLDSLGAQVSFSGSLMENLTNLAAGGRGFTDWSAPWREAMGWSTARGNPRVDLVAFGYHHPLMALLDEADLRMQVQAHREAAQRAFGRPPGRGIFPPECAFSERMIPALAAEGVAWTFVDNIHFDRAHVGYPYRPESNLAPPNRADQLNNGATDWVQLRDLWAPSAVAAPWGYRPHWVQHVDPATGRATRIIAVPAARYEGNEDARGGFGALSYERVMRQYEAQNTDPAHPMLVVLHHDGDNYGGGTESYYHSNFANFVSWVRAQPTRFVATTVQDYLDRFPPAPDDVVHVEDGAWSGADNGDPEFRKWNGAPGADGYSPDRNSWAVLTAAKNRVFTAESAHPHASTAAVIDGTGGDVDRAWHHLLNAETSCYWYWDNSEGGRWDSDTTRASNQAVVFADRALAGVTDRVGPTLYLPQRTPYNPGVAGAASDMLVWTLAYDLSGLTDVTLHWRVDADGARDATNDRYDGGAWRTAAMTARTLPAPRTDPLPTYRADEYSATVAGVANALVDYYVSSTDRAGNATRSPMQHVWIAR